MITFQFYNIFQSTDYFRTILTVLSFICYIHLLVRGDRGDFGHGERMDTSKSLTLLTLE